MVATDQATKGRLIYTDGACQGNPGPGGWGYVILDDGTAGAERCGGERKTTNNRMEMQAVIEALRALRKGEEVTIYTDSTYLKNGITSWIHKWKRNGWKTSAGQPVKNDDLWREMLQLTEPRAVTFRWVKGHAGNRWNERADELARKGIPR